MAEFTTTQGAARAAEIEAALIREALPRHVAVIMDGNGRWGIARGMDREYGHREAVDALRATVTAADDLGIGYLSLFCFSTENIERPVREVDSLFSLFDEVLDTETQVLDRRNVRIVISGMLDLLPAPLPAKFNQAVALTADNTGLTLNLCVMYSGRSELLEAVKRVVTAVVDGRFDLQRLDERHFEQFLFHPDIPDVDLTVRTSGEMRISNFLLWQMAYSELVFTDVLWPDFTRAEFLEALLEYQNRQRRFGKV